MATISCDCQVFKVPLPLLLSTVVFFLICSPVSSVSLFSPDVRNIKALRLSLKEIKMEWRIKFG